MYNLICKLNLHELWDRFGMCKEHLVMFNHILYFLFQTHPKTKVYNTERQQFQSDHRPKVDKLEYGGVIIIHTDTVSGSVKLFPTDAENNIFLRFLKVYCFEGQVLVI